MRNYKDVCAQMTDYIKIMEASFGGTKAAGEEGEEEAAPEEAAPVGHVPDLLDDA
jgi:hypothetical protein